MSVNRLSSDTFLNLRICNKLEVKFPNFLNPNFKNIIIVFISNRKKKQNLKKYTIYIFVYVCVCQFGALLEKN